MTVLLRVLAIGSAVGLAWTVAASRVIDREKLPLAAVVQGAVVTQPFGCTPLALEPFDPMCPSRHVHTGIDLAAAAGTAVHAATGGAARVAFDGAGAGLFVTVDYGSNVRILYCHLFTAAVTSGQLVKPGDLIGTVGSSGLATGPHVHFEVQVAGRSVDPGQWLAGGS